MKFKHSLFLSLALASTAFAQTKTLAYPGEAFGISSNAQFIVGREANIPGGTAGSQALIFTTADSVEKQLSSPDASGGLAFGVDNTGNVVGATSLSGSVGWMSLGSQAAAWDASGTYTNLHALVTGTAPTISVASGIDNSSGWTVGTANNGEAANSNAALWKKSGTTYTYTNLHDAVTASGSTAADSQAKGINANKTIAGTSGGNLGVWTTTDAGSSYSFTNLNSVAQRASDGKVAVGGSATDAYSGAISDNGSIVGSADFGSGWNAGLWKADSINGTTYTYTDLASQIATSGKTSTDSRALGINGGATKAVGFATMDGLRQATLWDLTTNSFSDLNDTYSAQLAGEEFQYLTVARDIADSGEIVGQGIGTDGQNYGFLINKWGTLYNIGILETVVAIPEPTSSVLLGLAGMSFLVRRKRK